jgi:hypothetical protein
MKIFRTWQFEWWEVSLIKVCLLSLGILLALYFLRLGEFMGLWWMFFIVTATYFIIRFFRET